MDSVKRVITNPSDLSEQRVGERMLLGAQSAMSPVVNEGNILSMQTLREHLEKKAANATDEEKAALKAYIGYIDATIMEESKYTLAAMAALQSNTDEGRLLRRQFGAGLAGSTELSTLIKNKANELEYNAAIEQFAHIARKSGTDSKPLPGMFGKEIEKSADESLNTLKKFAGINLKA